MFGNCNKEALKSKIDYLQEKVKVLESDVEHHKKLASIYREGLEKCSQPNHRDTPIAFNFDNIDVFSIERIKNKDWEHPKTGIGYWGTEVVNTISYKRTKEWYLDINDAMHKILVNKYNEHLAEKARLAAPEADRNKVVKK